VSLLSCGASGSEAVARQVLLLPDKDGCGVFGDGRPVTLTTRDREQLLRLTVTGVHPASAIRRARVLLALDISVG
jgi:hypothetical protein